MQDKFKILPWIINIVLIVFCLAPIGPQIPKPFEKSDLIYHALSYLLLTAIYLKFYTPKWVAPLLFIEGVLIEYIQPLFDRHFDVLDVIANGLGIVFGVLFVQIFLKYYPEYGPRKSTGPSRNTSE